MDKQVTCACGFLRDRLFWRPRVHTPADVAEREARLHERLNQQCPKCNGRNPEYAGKPGRGGATPTISPEPEADAPDSGAKPKRKTQAPAGAAGEPRRP